MRHSLPSSRFRRLGALTALAALVALATFSLAHADAPLPAQGSAPATASASR